MADETPTVAESTALDTSVRDEATASGAETPDAAVTAEASEQPAPKDYGKLLADLADMSDAEYDRWLRDNPNHPGQKVANARASRIIENARRDAAQRERARIEAEVAARQTEQQRLRDEQQELELLEKLEREDFETLTQQGRELAQKLRTKHLLRDPEVVERIFADPTLLERVRTHPELGAAVGKQAIDRVNEQVQLIRTDPNLGGLLGVDRVNEIWSGSRSFPDMVNQLHEAKLAKAIADGELIPKADFTKRLAAAQAQARSDALGGLPDRDVTPSVGASNGRLTIDTYNAMPAEARRALQRDHPEMIDALTASLARGN